LSYFTPFAHCGPHVALRTVDGDLILVEEAKDASRFGAAYSALELFVAVCELEPLIYNWRDRLLGRSRPSKPWRDLDNVHKINHILQANLNLASIAPGADYDSLAPGNLPENASRADRLRSSGFVLYPTLQLAFCQQILAAVTDVPEIVGFLDHPIHGVPEERWLYPETPK